MLVTNVAAPLPAHPFPQVFYFAASLRDAGWFFWMPLAGKWGYEAIESEPGPGEATKASLTSVPDVGSPLLTRKL